MKIKENKIAPNFKLPSTNGKIFELKKIKNKNTILYFYAALHTLCKFLMYCL